MGPPDKREPKMSSDAFEHYNKSSINSTITQPTTSKISNANVLQIQNTSDNSLNKTSPSFFRKVIYAS